LARLSRGSIAAVDSGLDSLVACFRIPGA
jgi:hypothetical protein